MKVYKKMYFNSPIVYLKVLDDNLLAIVTEEKLFAIVDLATMHTLQEFTFKHANVHKEKSSVAFSPDGKYLAYSELEQSVVRVIDIQSHKLHHSFPTLQNRIETLCFDPHSNYLIAGSITGRVYLWNLFSTGQVSRLSSFPEYAPHLLTQPKNNYVSAACFSASGNLAGTSGYGGSIVVTNIHTEVSPKRITPNHIRINALSFIDEDKIVAGNIEGAVDVIDLHTSQIEKHYQTGLNGISDIAVSSRGTYLLLAGHTKDIALIDLKKQKICDASYISRAEKITRVSITHDDVLVVGCEDGSITTYRLFPEETLESLLNNTACAQAYDLIHEYPLLEDSALAKEIEQEWEDALEFALLRAQEGNHDDALNALQKFTQIPAKSNAIKDVKNFIKHFHSFNSAVLHENYALAYSIAEQTPLLKRSAAYVNMEKIWDACFLKAQTYVITDQKRELIKVLEPFSRVNTKLCFIQVLLHQPALFLQFTHHVNTHAYDKLFSITHSYPCLKEIQSYKDLLYQAQELYIKSKEHLFSGELDLAELELEQLAHIPSMKEQWQELKHVYALALRLQNLYEDGDILSCYGLIDRNEVLQALPLSKELETLWNAKMETAEKEALLGNIKAIKTTLEKLLTLSTRSQKIGTLLRLGFLTQIKLLVIKKQISSIKTAIDAYIEMFGYDTELNNLILKLTQDKIIDIKLDDEQMYHRPRSLWLSITNGKIPDTILQGKNRYHDV